MLNGCHGNNLNNKFRHAFISTVSNLSVLTEETDGFNRVKVQLSEIYISFLKEGGYWNRRNCRGLQKSISTIGHRAGRILVQKFVNAFEFAHLIVTTIEHGADLVNEVYNMMGLDMMHKDWLLTLNKVPGYVEGSRPPTSVHHQQGQTPQAICPV